MEQMKQDLPPPGGFKAVCYERIPLKRYLASPYKWLMMLGVMAVGWYGFHEDKKRLNNLRLEKNGAYFSILPLLIAENDRAKLKYYRKLRDEEKELMKDVEGWKVGTYKGEPIYKTLEPDEWYEPSLVDAWGQADPQDTKFPMNLRISH